MNRIHAQQTMNSQVFGKPSEFLNSIKFKMKDQSVWGFEK